MGRKGAKMKLKPLENTVVHTPTKKEYDELMQIYEDAGWLSQGACKPTSRPYNKSYNCTMVCNYFSRMGINDYYELVGYSIITLDQFKKTQGIESEAINAKN